MVTGPISVVPVGAVGEFSTATVNTVWLEYGEGPIEKMDGHPIYWSIESNVLLSDAGRRLARQRREEPGARA
jgi:hypothetical protein